ncbi:dihydrodipicolinate synthase family protein [Sphingomonas sp. RB1R13]|uniref:dihydrodipicolinate synthase family protein n=1 Tax=Sphingomonas sp. RB1R13 TaxID=3096159 RepID=UPI002FC5C5C2
MVDLSGVFPIMPTVFDVHGELDREGMLNVVDYLVRCGATGVVFPGLASEHDQLTRQERIATTQAIGEWLAGRATFIVGASAATPADAITYARAGAEAGAVAAMVLTPSALGSDVEALTGFYDALGRQAGLPIMLQNAPAPMGAGLSPSTVGELAMKVDVIRFVKEEAMPSGQRITALARYKTALDGVFGGAGARYVIDELRRGAKGTMPACEITEVHVAMLAAFESGDENHARQLFERTLPLLSMQAVFRWRLTKEVLRRRGLIRSAFVRAPGPELDPFDHRELGVLLERIADLLHIAPVVAEAAQ